jgi:myo-inositol-1(or 4)-monophosphatase
MTGNIAYQNLEKHCVSLVKGAIKILKKRQKSAHVAVMKDEVDLATTADLASEKFIITAIKKRFPNHGIYSEEAGEVSDIGDYVWTVDPLDGTKEYARGGREYNTLIAVEQNSRLVASAMARAGIQADYSASSGNGTRRNGEDILVSKTSDIAKSFVGFHVPTRANPEEFIDKGVRLLDKLVHVTYRVRPGWDDAYYAAWVAEGILDAHVISPNVNKWYDIATGILLVREAGGKVTDWNGEEIAHRNLSHGIILSNGLIHEKLLEIIKSAHSQL